jgi:hypothetical protein
MTCPVSVHAASWSLSRLTGAVEQVGVQGPPDVGGGGRDETAGDCEPDGGVGGQGGLPADDLGGRHVLGRGDRAGVVAVVVQDVDRDAVTAEQGHRRGVDVDVVEGDEIADVGDGDADRGAIGPLNSDAVTFAADAAWLGQPVGTRGRSHESPQQ